MASTVTVVARREQGLLGFEILGAPEAPEAPAEAAPERAPRRRPFRSPWGRLVVLLAIVALLAGLALRRSPATPGITQAQVNRTVQAAVDKAGADAKAAPADSAVVYNTILPSLVYIRTDRTVDGSAGTGIGTGVIVNDQGSIMTAHHVVADATAIVVTFIDGSEAPAKIVSDQPDNDIAVLRADRQPDVIVPAVLGGGVRVGDEAFAVGHPLGLTRSLSAGVVSGLGRAIPLEGGGTLKGLIQFDAAVNPGNSGGPLLNRDGQVVGIVTALANPSKQGFFIGIGFAVPIATAAGGGPGEPSQ